MGLSRWTRNPRGAPVIRLISPHLLVHHTANANTATDWAAVVRAIWSFHIFTNGWSDIGYNYLIDPNVIYEGAGAAITCWARILVVKTAARWAWHCSERLRR
ncbi:MAG: hypothetical protein U0Y68_17395 [Blastocatellia bacterium]